LAEHSTSASNVPLTELVFEDPMSNRRYYLILFVITLCAWGLRLAVTERFVGLSSVPDPVDGLDQLDYEVFAHQMSVGNGYVLADGTPSARRAPGTSLVLLPVYGLFGRSFLAARMWMTFLSAITCWASAWVVRRSLGTTAALVTAAGVAVNPGLFYYAIHLWSEAPFCLAMTLATGFTVRAWCDQHWNDRVAAGLCWGIALLIRPQVVFMAPFVALAWVLCRGVERRRLFVEAAVQMAIVAVIAAPWVIRNTIVMHKPTLATLVGGHTFWGAHNARTFHDPHVRGIWITLSEIPGGSVELPADELQQESIAWRNGIDSVRQNMAALPQLLLWKLYRLVTPFEDTPNRAVYWAFAVAWMVTAPLAVFGFKEVWQRDPVLGRIIGLQFAATVLCVLMFYGASRFRHAVEPLLMVAAGVGVSRWCARRECGPVDSAVPCMAASPFRGTPEVCG
jgi:4-amino-4-deoxy-L-arabinose transferase-like glycosyltransferase